MKNLTYLGGFNNGNILSGSRYRSIQRTSHSGTYGKWKDGTGGSLSFRKWNGKKGDELCWEFDRLFKEVINGLKKCKEIGKIPVSMGVDTWGVDFVLLDKDGNVLGNTVGYRDSRTEGMDDEVYKVISQEELYARTGIQKAIYNTIYQLMSVKTKHPEYLEQAETLLHVPDYFHYLLTGVKSCEYTEATTSQLVSPATKDWDFELIDKLGYQEKSSRS